MDLKPRKRAVDYRRDDDDDDDAREVCWIG